MYLRTGRLVPPALGSKQLFAARWVEVCDRPGAEVHLGPVANVWFGREVRPDPSSLRKHDFSAAGGLDGDVFM